LSINFLAKQYNGLDLFGVIESGKRMNKTSTII